MINGNPNRNNKEYFVFRNNADNLSAIAKFHSSNSAFDSANRSVQIFGSAAYRKSNRVARHFLDSRAITIYEGTNEILELKVASKILGDDYKAKTKTLADKGVVIGFLNELTRSMRKIESIVKYPLQQIFTCLVDDRQVRPIINFYRGPCLESTSFLFSILFDIGSDSG
jgi:diphthamide synthase subunit DPH2